MADLNVKEVADALYSSFLARDFFAKVVPGGIVLAALLASSLDKPIDWSLELGHCLRV